MSLFTDICWRHFPKSCNCPPSPDEVDRMRSDIFLLDRELLRENRRAREFSQALSEMANAIGDLVTRRAADGYEENVPADIHYLHMQAREALDLLGEPRNQDRVSELMKRIVEPIHGAQNREKSMNKESGYINLDFGVMFAGIAIAGAVIGVALAYVVPWLWGIVKPLIHALTA